MKCIVSFYLKGESKDTKTFDTIQEAVAFKQGMLKNDKLESISIQPIN